MAIHCKISPCKVYLWKISRAAKALFGLPDTRAADHFSCHTALFPPGNRLSSTQLTKGAEEQPTLCSEFLAAEMMKYKKKKKNVKREDRLCAKIALAQARSTWQDISPTVTSEVEGLIKSGPFLNWYIFIYEEMKMKNFTQIQLLHLLL